MQFGCNGLIWDGTNVQVPARECTAISCFGALKRRHLMYYNFLLRSCTPTALKKDKWQETRSRQRSNIRFGAFVFCTSSFWWNWNLPRWGLPCKNVSPDTFSVAGYGRTVAWTGIPNVGIHRKLCEVGDEGLEPRCV